MCLVSESSNSVRSLINPALHVGKQIEGGVGCRACTGRDGIAAGATTAAGKGGAELCAQPLANVRSSIGISTRARQFLFGFINHPLQRVHAPLFLGPGRGLGRCCRTLQAGNVLGVLHAGLGMVALLGRQAVGLQAQQPKHDQQEGGERPGHHDSQPRYFGDRTASTSLTWCRLMSQADRPP